MESRLFVQACRDAASIATSGVMKSRFDHSEGKEMLKKICATGQTTVNKKSADSLYNLYK